MTQTHTSLISQDKRRRLGGVPDGYQPLVLADMARLAQDRVVFIARDAGQAAALRTMLDLSLIHI